METIIGFVAGYMAGCQDGPDGIKRLRSAAADIMNSDEIKRLMAETMRVLVSRAASSRSLGELSGTVGGVTDMLVHRASATRNRSSAA